MQEITKKEICKCLHCGNEAEMIVTCSLTQEDPAQEKTSDGQDNLPRKVKGTATCTHCGNEADMWIDI